MKISELLFEYDVQKIEGLNPLLSTRTPDTSMPQVTTALELADILEKRLNISSGEVVFWILYRYLKLVNGEYGIKRWEDIGSRVVPALKKFTILKNKKKISVDSRDLNKFKSLSQLEDLLDTFPDTELASQKAQSAAEEAEFYNSKEAKLLYNDSQIKVVIPYTEDASMYFGKNTRWCTAAKNDNLFSVYNRKGRLYIVLIKPLNQRFQFHWPEMQFMNERDEDINPHELAEKYPVLWKIFTPIAKRNKSIILNADTTEDMQAQAVRTDAKLLKYIKNPSEEMQLSAFNQGGTPIKYIQNPSEAIQLAAVKAYNRYWDGIGMPIMHIKNPTEAVQLLSVELHPHSYYYIDKPTPKVTDLARSKGLDVKKWT